MSSYGYYYGDQSDMYSFVRIPTRLLTDKQYQNVSTDAKLLYGLFLSRMSLSARNKWFDDQGRVFIIFTVDEVIDQLGFSRQKTIRLYDELENKIGLIEKVRRGNGKPNIIYVKKFMPDIPEKSGISEQENADFSFHGEVVNTRKNRNNTRIESPENPASDIEKSGKTEEKSCKIEEIGQKTPENDLKYENHTSRSMKIILPEVPNSYPNYIDSNYIDSNYNRIVSNPTIVGNTRTKYKGTSDTMRYDAMTCAVSQEEYDLAVLEVKQLIDYSLLIEYDFILQDELDEIVDVIAEVLCSKKKTIRISGQEHTVSKICKRLRSLNSEHIIFVIESMSNTTTEIKNIRKYLLATLYNAPVSINSYYGAKVRSDFAKNA